MKTIKVRQPDNTVVEVPEVAMKYAWDLTVSIDGQPLEIGDAIAVLVVHREFYRTQVADLKQQLDELRRKYES